MSIPLAPRLRRFLFPAVAVAVVAALAGLAIYVGLASPPRAARLLPESDGIVYANLKPIRLATHLETKPVPHSPDYQQFIDATGIVFERDLDSVAFALHKMPDASGPNGMVAYSEVFVGKFDQDRLTKYLASVAKLRESYAGHDIFTIPMGPTGRQLRVTQLSSNTIAASNAPTTEQIHAILDRYRPSLNPFSGSTLLTGLYPDVPMFSPVWGIGAIGLPFSEDGHVAVVGLHLPLPDTTPLVASLRYTMGLHLRIEEIAANDDGARHTTQKLTTLVTLLNQMEQFQAVDRADSGMRDLTQSIKIQQKGDRAILTADVPLALVKKLTSPGSVPAAP